MHYITENEIDKITSDTIAQLQKEPRVSITVKPDNGEKFWEGGINGHFFRIKTDTPVCVPVSLAKVIALSNAVRVASERSVDVYRKGGGKKVS